MNHNEQVWEEYLSRRPNLKKWCEQNLSDHFFSNRTDILKDKVMNDGKTKYGKKVTDLDDGEALAYFVIYFNNNNDDNLLINSKAVKHVQPSISLDEARLATKQYVSYIHLLCVRELDGDFTSKESLADMAFAVHVLMTLDNYVPHMVWDTEHDLIRTAIEYDIDYCRLFEARCNKVIDSDYLDHYLLAPKPDPTDIDKDTWHRMSVRLVKRLDEENENTKDTRLLNNDLLGFVADGLASCFLTHNLEDLSFMETIYDFCIFASNYPEFMNRNVRDSYLPGMLDPKLFDLLREYGSAFVEPLLENSLITKGERTS